jgi:hypothetical protein
MEAASAVESSASMKTSATVEALTTVKAAAMELTTRREATAEAATLESSVKAASTEAATVESSIKAAPAETRTEESTSAKAATEPGSGSDKDASREPIRPIVAIRRAGIGVVPVIAVSARRRYVTVVITITRTIDRPAESNADCDSLRVGGNGRRRDANTE